MVRVSGISRKQFNEQKPGSFTKRELAIKSIAVTGFMNGFRIIFVKQGEIMYQFVPRQEMRSVLDIANFPENSRAEIAYRYFVYDSEEAMYIEENGVLIGMVSIGDLERYYGNRKDRLEINRLFSRIGEKDEAKAAVFFGKFKTFFECPIVNSQGQLEGVMKRAIRYDIRQDQIASLVVSRYLKEQWHRKELSRFVANTKVQLVLYYTEEAPVMRALADRKRSGVTDGDREGEEIYWKGLSEKQWDAFLGEPGIAGNLKREFGNFHTQLIKGVSEIIDMKGEFYNCVGGSRITHGNPQKSDRRVIFYGACSTVGAYCRDGETIESYFQNILNIWRGSQTKPQIQVINRGLFNVTNFFSRMMTDKLSGRDIAVVFVEKRWLTEEISRRCLYVGNLTDTYLEIENLKNNLLDSPDHCNYRVNRCLAERIYRDFEGHHLLDMSLNVSGGLDEAGQIQDYYIGSEVMSEVLRYMEQYDLLKEEAAGIKGAMTLFADPFTERHRRAVETVLQKVDRLYVFLSEDSNLKFSLEERLLAAKEAVRDLGDRVVIIPAGKYLFTKKISRGIRKQRFCDADMEYDCDIFGELFGGFMGIRYRFLVSEFHNSVEQKYMDICINILPQFGITVEEL